MSSPLIDLAELDTLLAGSGAARLLDARWRLGDPTAGRAIFEAGHIPGAVHVDMDRDLASAPGLGGRHPLPSAEQFAAAMSRAGVGAATTAVVYDSGDGSGAARLWWLLRHFGHQHALVLDGGFTAWLAAGRPAETGSGRLSAPAQFEAHPRGHDYVDLAEMQRALEEGAIHLLDARAPQRWRGDVEPVDPIAGRIPGSLNAPAGENIRDNRFRPAAELREHYERLGIVDGKPIVASCGSGISACVDILALEVAGVGGAKLFPGSYSGWIANGLPVERGGG